MTGAIGARAIHHLRSSYGEDLGTLYDNNSYTITAIYSDEILTRYASYTTTSIGHGAPETTAKLTQVII